MLASKAIITAIAPTAAGLAFTAGSYLPDLTKSMSSLLQGDRLSIGLPAEYLSDNTMTGAVSWCALQELQKLFIVNNVPDILAFLDKQLAALIIGAEPVIREYFECSKISLRIQTDPEESSQTLLVQIHSKTDWHDSEERLDSFDKNWWLKQKWVPSSKRIVIDVST